MADDIESGNFEEITEKPYKLEKEGKVEQVGLTGRGVVYRLK